MVAGKVERMVFPNQILIWMTFLKGSAIRHVCLALDANRTLVGLPSFGTTSTFPPAKQDIVIGPVSPCVSVCPRSNRKPTNQKLMSLVAMLCCGDRSLQVGRC